MSTPSEAEFWFDIADGVRPLSDIPDDLRDEVLGYLNKATVDEIAYSVPMLDGWTAEPRHSRAIVEARGEGFDSIEQLWDVPGLGPARFTEVLRSIGNTDPVVPVDLASGREQPANSIVSSAETELKFDYEILAPGPLQGLRGGFPAPPVIPAHGSRC